MRGRLGECPEPPPRPVWEPTPLASLLVFVIPILALIAAFHGWKPGWWIAGILWSCAFIIAGFVRNDCR